MCVLFNQIDEYFSSHNLYNDSQYGFEKKHSTEHAALELVDGISQELDKGNTPLNIFLDLSKAFDTLDHFYYNSTIQIESLWFQWSSAKHNENLFDRSKTIRTM